MKTHKTVLVVDDDPGVRNGIRELLKTDGFDVIVAADGAQGLRKGLARQPDLTILDINLPHLSGFEVCRKLREEGYYSPIILLTTRNDESDKVLGLEIGAVDYMTKPFSSREILARVRAQIRSAEQAAMAGTEHQPPGAGKRKILAVVFTDMKNFSFIMNRDEKLALQMLKDQKRRITGAVRKHSGTIIEIIGDAFLITFETGFQAVKCSLDILRSLDRYNSRRSTEKQIQIRIGVHMGDVTLTKGGVRGNTINVAARLQQIGLPGSVTMSQIVYDSVRGKTAARLIKVGPRKVKNIPQLIDVYRARLAKEDP